HLGTDRTAAAFSAVDPAALDDAVDELVAGRSPLTPGPAFAFVIDEHSLPAGPESVLADGAGSTVPLLLGTNRDEYRLWIDPNAREVSETALHRAADALGVGRRVLDRYAARTDNSFDEILGRIASDHLIWLPAMNLAEARRSTHAAATFMYQFDWSPGEL